MKKHIYIRRFINDYKPTRKQLEIFCKYCGVIGSDAKQLPTINKSNTTNVSYDAFVKWLFKVDSTLTKNKLGVNGWYGANIAKWKSIGNVIVKRGKYHLTKECIEEGNSLYKRTKKRELNHYKYWANRFEDLYWEERQKNQILNREKFQEEREQKNINSFLYTMESLIEQYNYLKKSL